MKNKQLINKTQYSDLRTSPRIRWTEKTWGSKRLKAQPKKRKLVS